MTPGISWLFLYDMRVSTVVVWLAFVLVGVLSHDLKRALLAGMTWLLGWEVAWQLARWLTSDQRGLGWTIAFFAASIAFVLLLQRKAIRPSVPLLGLGLAVGAVWLATGFHINGYNLPHFDPLAEALNEGAKTAWGLAYLWPLAHRAKVRDGGPLPVGDRLDVVLERR
jgi:hypothetical protein